MKKALTLFLSCLLVMALSINAFAEEFNGADLFTVDLPEGYEQTGAAASDFSFIGKDGSAFTVTYTENGEDNSFCPKSFSEKKLKAYAEDICTDAKEAMKEFSDDFDMKVVSCEKKEHPDSTEAVVIILKTTVTQNGETNVYYQKLYEFGGINNKYSFSFTTSDANSINDMDSAFESIDIFEAYLRSGTENIAVYSIAAVMAAVIVAGIIRFIRTPEKRRSGKIK